jgi:ribosomal protein S27E
MDVSCPQCGNPNLDVDAQNNVVFCKKCGFAVKVDPQTGNVTPISEGGAAAPAESAQSQPSYSGGESPSIIGMDPLTFFLLFSAILMLLLFMGLDLSYVFLAEIVLFLIYWYKH